MAVLLVQLQAPDNGLYNIPWTDCTENPSEGGRETDADASMSSGGSFLFFFYLVRFGLLTGLQEALQLHRADELLPFVRPPGNDAEQLLGYNDAQSEGQVGFINSGDEERTTRLHTEEKKYTRHTLPAVIITWAIGVFIEQI